jgi:hypothetical protein
MLEIQPTNLIVQHEQQNKQKNAEIRKSVKGKKHVGKGTYMGKRKYLRGFEEINCGSKMCILNPG